MTNETAPALHSIQRYMIAGCIMMALVTFGIGGWAATSELSGAVIGQGVLVVDSSVKKVQHPTGGVVGELRVRDGDKVKAGQILVRLDETQNSRQRHHHQQELRRVARAPGAPRG